MFVALRIEIPRLETPRLSLTPLVVEDAREMADVLADPALYDFTGGAPESVEQLAARYGRWSRGSTTPGQRWVNMIVRDRAARCAVGYVQATTNPELCDVAWVIGARWQRRGYATEATRALIALLARDRGVRALRALIRPDHTASQIVAARLGLARTDGVVDGEEVWLGEVDGVPQPAAAKSTPRETPEDGQ